MIQQKERLLLSVLPKHVAAEIRQDLGAVVEGQFHKIYMRYFFHLSILSLLEFQILDLLIDHFILQ